MIYKGEMRTVNESDFIPVSFNEKEIFIYMIEALSVITVTMLSFLGEITR